jgi:hypothetical protein
MTSRKRLLRAISAGLLPADSSQLSKSLIRNWVTKYISTGEAPMAQNGFGGTNRWGEWDALDLAGQLDFPGRF